MKTNLNFSIKLPIKTKISLFFSHHYFQNRRVNNNISTNRAIKNISINNVKSIIKPQLDTLVKHKGRYLFTIYTDNTRANKAYFLIVSENQNLEDNSLNFVVVSAGTSSNLNIKFKNIAPHKRFFISDFTCEDLINQDKIQNKIREEKWEISKKLNESKISTESVDALLKRKPIARIDKDSALLINTKNNLFKPKHNLAKHTRIYRSSATDNYFSKIENRFLAIEKRLKKIKVPFSINDTLSIDYLNYLEELLIEFGQSSLSKGSYENILTTSNNLRELLTDRVVA